MIARLTLTLLEWTAAVCAALVAASAAGPSDLVAAGVLAVAAASTRSLAMSRAAGRRLDDLLLVLRAATRPSNDAGGL